MKIIFDPYADSIHITFRKGKVDETIEIAPEVNLDVDEKKRPLYLEIIGAREKLGKVNAEEFLMKTVVPKKQNLRVATTL